MYLDVNAGIDFDFQVYFDFWTAYRKAFLCALHCTAYTEPQTSLCMLLTFLPMLDHKIVQAFTDRGRHFPDAQNTHKYALYIWSFPITM